LIIRFSVCGIAGAHTHFKPRDDAFEALKLRYAEGEITKEQFQEMKKTLGAED